MISCHFRAQSSGPPLPPLLNGNNPVCLVGYWEDPRGEVCSINASASVFLHVGRPRICLIAFVSLLPLGEGEGCFHRQRLFAEERGRGLGGEGGLPVGGGLQLLLGGWEGQPLGPMVLLTRALALSSAREAPPSPQKTIIVAANVCRGGWWTAPCTQDQPSTTPWGQDLGRLAKGRAHRNGVAGQSALGEILPCASPGLNSHGHIPPAHRTT